MGQSKFSRYVGALLFTIAISCTLGFWWARTSGSDSWLLWAKVLIGTLITLVVCAGYMAAVGLYHTILAVLGLDGQPGIFSKGARTGPFSGMPDSYQESTSAEETGADGKSAPH